MIREDCDREDGGFAEIARRLGLSEQNILSRAVAIFQKHKLAFPQLLVRDPLYIRGSNKAGMEIPLASCVLFSRLLMREPY
jgi:hypothetical protein